MKYHIKLITGFREDQEIDIPMQEAHKAYYLFRNPDERGVFENGIAIIGKDIRKIVPDWNKTMGWNATHKLDDDDWNEIRRYGVEDKMRKLLEIAEQTIPLVEKNMALMKMPLVEVMKLLPPPDEKAKEIVEGSKALADKMSLG